MNFINLSPCLSWSLGHPIASKREFFRVNVEFWLWCVPWFSVSSGSDDKRVFERILRVKPDIPSKHQWKYYHGIKLHSNWNTSFSFQTHQNLKKIILIIWVFAYIWVWALYLWEGWPCHGWKNIFYWATWMIQSSCESVSSNSFQFTVIQNLLTYTLHQVN